MMPDAKTAARPLLFAALLGTAALSLSACAPLVVGGAAATTAVVISDRRTSGAQLEDKNIAYKVERDTATKLGASARVNAMAYNGVVLLTGDVPSEAAKSQAAALAQNVQHVKKVVNQLNVGPAASFSTRSNDTWLSSKVRTALINTKYVPSGTIDLTTDRGVVYLMGLVTEAEGNYAATAASEVGGVSKVVKLFEVISREEALRLSGSSTQQQGSQSGNAQQQSPAPIESGGGGTVDGVQAIPIK
ncbi:BON domain-containing protein [Bordetella genomosp. 2]|uniref:Phospholipid-binding protein n=1 Tax=Bordetella genomosp. 2 TaxID=1983456 RepID=A0A261VF82_9BORD|nr:BON domain-containing protein [Bordetella genomosp. 2]OZI72806.1 phospholipid-binding protein [Bordetella genomosp. 2]